jgi:hypothetical protein
VNRGETQVLTTEQELVGIGLAWETLRNSLAEPTLENRRGWLESEASSGEGMMVVALGNGIDTRAIAPFLLKRWKLQCRVGYTSVVSFPMLVARLCGDAILAPQQDDLQEALLEGVAKAGVPYHALFIEGLHVDSALRQLIDRSPVVKEHFWKYCPTAPAKHWMVRMPKTFSEFDSWLGAKRRAQFKASERKLSAACGSPVGLQRVTSPDDIPAFIEAIAHLSKSSWQGRKLGQTIEVGDPQCVRIADFARRGWFRGYLLRSESEAIAFVIGFQSDGAYHYMKIGYDPKWSAFSPGNVALYRLIEDLCSFDRVNTIDFGGGDSQYKRVFGNESFDEQNIFLLRRSIYTGLAKTTHSAFVHLSNGLRAGLHKTGLLERARRSIRST